MYREKRPEELDQERADEALARRMQEEMNAEAGARGVFPSGPGGAPQQFSRITCQSCRSINNIPVNSTTNQFLCGHCRRLLAFNQGPAEVERIQREQMQQQHRQTPPQQQPEAVSQQPPNRQIPTDQPPAQPRVLQGSSLVPQTVQVRCGHCQMVNAIQKQRSGVLQFMCGECRSLNEVNVQ